MSSSNSSRSPSPERRLVGSLKRKIAENKKKKVVKNVFKKRKLEKSKILPPVRPLTPRPPLRKSIDEVNEASTSSGYRRPRPKKAKDNLLSDRIPMMDLLPDERSKPVYFFGPDGQKIVGAKKRKLSFMSRFELKESVQPEVASLFLPESISSANAAPAERSTPKKRKQGGTAAVEVINEQVKRHLETLLGEACGEEGGRTTRGEAGDASHERDGLHHEDTHVEEAEETPVQEGGETSCGEEGAHTTRGEAGDASHEGDGSHDEDTHVEEAEEASAGEDGGETSGSEEDGTTRAEAGDASTEDTTVPETEEGSPYDISSGDDSFVDRAYVPPDDLSSSSDDSDEEPPARDVQLSDRAQERRARRRNRAIAEGRRLRRPKGTISQFAVPLYSTSGKQFSLNPEAIKSRRRRLALKTLTADDSSDSAQPSSGRIRRYKPGQLRPPPGAVTDHGIQIFKNVSARDQKLGKLNPAPCKANPVLAETNDAELEKLLADANAMLHRTEEYLFKIRARMTIDEAFAAAREKVEGEGSEDDPASAGSGTCAINPMKAMFKRTPKCLTDRNQEDCLIPSCNGRAVMKYMRRHYESAHNFLPNHAITMQSHHHNLVEINKRKETTLDAKSLTARCNFVINSVMPEIDLRPASQALSEALLPLSIVNAIVDGLGKGTVLKDQTAKIVSGLVKNANDGEATSSTASSTADVELSTCPPPQPEQEPLQPQPPQQSAEDEEWDRHLRPGEKPKLRFITLCPRCHKPFLTRRLKTHLLTTEKLSEEAADLAYEHAQVHEELVLLDAVPTMGKAVAKITPPEKIKELRQKFTRGHVALLEIKMIPPKIIMLSPKPGRELLEKRVGTPLVTQAVMHYEDMDIRFQQAFPKLFEILTDFHRSLLNLDSTSKGQTAADKNLKDFLVVIFCYIASLPQEERIDIDIKWILRNCNRMLHSFRQVVGGVLRQGTMIRQLRSVSIFALYVNNLWMSEEQLGNFSVGNVKELVHQHNLVILRDYETHRHFEPIDERNLRTMITVDAINRLLDASKIKNFCELALSYAEHKRTNAPIPFEEFRTVMPTRKTALYLRDVLITVIGIQTARRSLEMTTFN
ncbi:uncharacterized protein LOC108676707 [Hyalella azteca]|uniref:Uncharacterized protein LOC108676707 n=1 Tax=Hyalella azteca TaxID=294128 RepID=A0A8B7P2J3_HYAAZ|nr:uncharacterized protein LOC108676707 [Hyalella azteca]